MAVVNLYCTSGARLSATWYFRYPRRIDSTQPAGNPNFSLPDEILNSDNAWMKALANLEGGVLPLIFMKLISTEVRPMATHSHSCGVAGCNFEIPEGLKGQGR